MPNGEEINGIRELIEGRIAELTDALVKMEGYLELLREFEQAPAPSAAAKILRGHRPALQVPLPSPKPSKPPKPEGQKRCQACKQMRPESEYAMGAQRPKRRCIHCDAGEKPKPPAAPKRVAPPPDPGKVYSKIQKCPKCLAQARFERPANATVSDHWTCLENLCELRIGNYNMPIDRGYTGKGAAA